MTLRTLFFSVLSVAAAATSQASVRQDIPLPTGWRFHFGDVPAATLPTFDDSGWAAISVPHTWNAQDGQDGVKTKGSPMDLMKGDYARGRGWYRLAFATDPEWKGHQVYLQFDGANRTTQVYLNGRLLGTHVGGNARFRFDLTSVLNANASNELVVSVDNHSDTSIPMSADFTFFGGLYRGVSLLVTDPVQIETMDYASPGVFLAQTAVSADSASVSARVELANHSSKAASVTVKATVFDGDHSVVTASAPATMDPSQPATVTLPITIDHPHLWNGRADPHLYRVVVEVVKDGAVTDSIEQPLGLRFYRVDPQQGFILNGSHVDLHGVSRHQDRQDKGWAISPDDDREDFGLISEIGATAIRVAHYQQSPLWYQLADEKGIVLWSEVPFVDEAIRSRDLFNNALDQMRELIRQNYNHPAVCFWGCGNENGDGGTNFAERIAHYGPISEQLIQALNALAHQEDPTRLTTYASFHSETDVNFAMPGMKPMHYSGEPQRWYTDVTDFNKYFGWYYGEPEDGGRFFDAVHAKYPQQPVGVSEYGAGGALTQHDDTAYGAAGSKTIAMDQMRPMAFAKFHPEEYQAYYHEHAWASFKERPYLWSKFVWNMFDFASDGRNEGDAPGRNDKGLVSYDRKTRKDAFYFYKANWSAEPVLHLNSQRFTLRTVAATRIKAYSNASKVEAFLNGKSLGVQTGSDVHVFTWEGVTLSPGENRIEVKADGANGPLADACTWTLAPAKAQP